MGELLSLWSCTVGSTPSVSKARNRNPQGWVFWDSRVDVGSFCERGRTVGQLARWMYLNGYDLRHFVVGGVTPAVIEIILRAYVMLRHYSERGEVKLDVAQSPKYRSMLLAAHGVAAAANAGKVALYQGNPLAVNQAEWMAFLRYLFPHMKYWLFDRQRLKLEQMARINEAGWNELVLSSDRVLERVAANNVDVVHLGRAETAPIDRYHTSGRSGR